MLCFVVAVNEYSLVGSVQACRACYATEEDTMRTILATLVGVCVLGATAHADVKIRSAHDYVRVIYGSGAATVPKAGCPCGVKRWKPYHNKWTGHVHIHRYTHTVGAQRARHVHDIHCSTPGLHAWWRPTFCRKKRR